eukprot:TRINITY_DN12245_c0_g1_i1.p1 TRINITY_DN12245_c0_g1~~TRINITY_DN12245_c0_g1_i1.p1  ORF type:complete len:133 (-),score=15.14 TRINITY_DN12245_c0_g1_i1:60-458(-)
MNKESRGSVVKRQSQAQVLTVQQRIAQLNAQKAAEAAKLATHASPKKDIQAKDPPAPKPGGPKINVIGTSPEAHAPNLEPQTTPTTGIVAQNVSVLSLTGRKSVVLDEQMSSMRRISQRINALGTILSLIHI